MPTKTTSEARVDPPAAESGTHAAAAADSPAAADAEAGASKEAASDSPSTDKDEGLEAAPDSSVRQAPSERPTDAAPLPNDEDDDSSVALAAAAEDTEDEIPVTDDMAEIIDAGETEVPVEPAKPKRSL